MEMLERYNISSETATKLLSPMADVRKFLYLVQPGECTFQRVSDVPYYFSEVFPLFIGLVFAEYVALAMQGKSPRLAESLNSLAHGILSETFKILTMGIEISLYIYIHRNFRLIDLSWDNPVTWYLTLLGVDLAYYFSHRASHEVNFLWALHQIHHSSEDFNMSVAIRHPIAHNWINSFFYLPLALIVPPPHCLAHQQLNLLYQGWIHTSLVGNLGPLEYIFNTPSHHKVHHGCNLYVLDKNFGGLLIIWDRLFGTFQEAREEEELVFGIVFQHQSHNPIWQMYYRWPALCQWSKMQATWKDAIRAVCYGPSWVPGAPRTGCDSDKVDIKPRPKYIVHIPKWLQAYILIHFFMVCLVFQEFALKKGKLDQAIVVMTVAYLLLSLTSIGLLSEGNPWGSYFELFRSFVFLILGSTRTGLTESQKDYWLAEEILNLYFISSSVLWLLYILYQGIVGAKEDWDPCLGDDVEELDRKIGDSRRKVIENKDYDEKKKPKIFDWTSINNNNNNGHRRFGRRRRHSCEEESGSSRRGSSSSSGDEYLVESKSFVDQRKLN